MMQELDLTLSWIRVGGITGLLGIASYLAAAFVPMPDVMGYAAAFAFGPCIAIGFVGLYYCLAFEKRSPLTQIAMIFGVAGGITVLIMLTTQQAIFGVMRRAIERAGDAASGDAYRKIEEGLNAVHLGMDVAWDVLISVSVMLFAWSMISHPKFGRVLGGLGVILGGLLLAFNVWYFPIPPDAAHSIDWGPFVALWMLIAFIQLLRAAAWLRTQSSHSATAN